MSLVELRERKCERCGAKARSCSYGHWGCSAHYGQCAAELRSKVDDRTPDQVVVDVLMHEGHSREAANAIVYGSICATIPAPEAQ